jgi:hypothetical protein
VRNLADVDREDRAAGFFDAADDFGLNAQTANESIEVRDDHDVRLASLDEPNRLPEPRPPSERGAT